MYSSCSIRSSRHKTLRKKCVFIKHFQDENAKFTPRLEHCVGIEPGTFSLWGVACLWFWGPGCVFQSGMCGQLVFAGLTVDLHVSIPHVRLKSWAKNKGCFLFSWTNIYIWFLFFFLNNKPTSVLLLKPCISTPLETMAGKAKQEKDWIQWLFLSKMKLPRAPCDSQTDQSSDQFELEFGEQSEHCCTVWSHATVW